MDERNVEQVVMWASAMGATLIERGFYPVVTIGAKENADGSLQISAAAAPGCGDEEVRAAVTEVLDMMLTGHYKVKAVPWQVE